MAKCSHVLPTMSTHWSGTEPEHYHNHHIRGNAGRRSDHDAEYLSADDADRTCDPANFYGLIGLVTKKSQKFFRDQQEYLGHINGQVEEVYGGHLVIKAFNRERDTIEEFEKTNNILYDSAWKSQFLSGMMQPIMMFVGNLATPAWH